MREIGGWKWNEENDNSFSHLCIYFIDAKSQVLKCSIGAIGLVVLVESVMVQCLRYAFVLIWVSIVNECCVHSKKAMKSVSYPWVYIEGRGYGLWDCDGCGCRLGASMYYSKHSWNPRRNEMGKQTVQWKKTSWQKEFLKGKERGQPCTGKENNSGKHTASWLSI